MDQLSRVGILCVLSLASGFILYAYIYGRSLDMILTDPPIKSFLREHRSHEHSTDVSQILLWSPTFWGSAIPQSKLGDGVFQDLGCKVRDCSLVTDHKLYHNSSAVFYLFEQTGTPPRGPRPPGQRWIFFTMESPQIMWRSDNYVNWKSLFNWTITYSLDSDVVAPYSVLQKRENPLSDHRDYPAIMKAKPKTAAWMVSKCGSPSGRDQYVKEMIKHGINVDIYGRCGKLKCPRSNRHHCMEDINKTYKFYLAFENSLCVDYVTEKFFKVLPYDVIPIVRGGANYTKLIPHKWYINTADFASVKDLAKYLKYLDKNPREYSKYFEGKNKYIFRFNIGIFENNVWCDLCEKLRNPKEPQKYYSNIGAWWNAKTYCKKPTDI